MGNEMERIVIHEYDPAWPAMFEAERERVAAALAGHFWEIEHVGSSAVPGLAAKPILDLMVTAETFLPVGELRERLEPLGYRVGHASEEHLFFKKGMPRTHHLHFFIKGSWEERRHVLFRDYLRAHPDALRGYEVLKRGLAEKYADNREAYTDSKTAFIEGVVKKALAVEKIREQWPDLQVESMEKAVQGENNDVYIVNDEYVFRFPKYEQGIVQLRAETAILEALQGRVSLPIPMPVVQDLSSGKVGEVFVGYLRLPGEPLTKDLYDSLDGETQAQVARELAAFLKELHGTPVQELLPEEILDTMVVSNWRREWSDLYSRFQTKLFPYMREEAKQSVAGAFEAFLADERNFAEAPVLAHNDFGPGNLLFDRENGRIGGVIDFGLAALGDPAVDAGNLVRYGADFLQHAIEVYPQIAGYLARARFYLSTFALQEALFGVEHGDEDAFEKGMAGYR